ncbi:MAG: DUF4214 domain-containing protein [Pseudomonadota bacterium]
MNDFIIRKRPLNRKVFWLSLLLLIRLVVLQQAAAGDTENYTYKLSASTSQLTFWTTPPSERVFKQSATPTDTGSEIKVYAARSEHEPFQVIVMPSTSQNLTVTMGDFGLGIKTLLYQVKHIPIIQATDSLGQTGDYPDPLWPLENGASFALNASENTAIWVNVEIPETAPAGDYEASIGFGALSIPVRLHVFNFSLPQDQHIASQMNFSYQTILSKYGVTGTGSEYWNYVDMIKQFFIDHRLTPSSVNWPGGITGHGGAPFIDYDCNTGAFYDPYGIWGFEKLAQRYLTGSGMLDNTFPGAFNSGTGFSSFMAMTFQNNDASADQRPSTFCGLIRSSDDWYTADNANSAYNEKWFNYVTELEDYLSSSGYLDKAYYYFANEPQDQADYDAVAWYSRYLKQAAPSLKLMVSENPRAEIFQHANYVNDRQIDIWLPVLNQYDPTVSHDREKNHGEATWIYFLHGTRPPYFNPITLDHPGIESKFTGWFLWKYRIKGIAYYSLNNWSKNPWNDPMTSNHNGDTFMLYPPSESNTNIVYGANNHRLVSSIRFELMRDSLEDYEYLYVLNGGAPAVGIVNAADTQADKIISGLTSYTRDSEFMYNLRRLIGLKNGSEITSIPDIQPASLHARCLGSPGDYYINFQDPTGSPTDDPIVVNDKTYSFKIGWSEYDRTLGYGWYGDMDHVMYQYLSSGPNVLQRSILYDDWGREKIFEFDLPNGTYNVTVSVGWQGKTYSHNKIVVEGITFINNEASSPYIVRTRQLSVSDNKLTMAMGIFDEYTMLNYMDIEADNTSGIDSNQGFVEQQYRDFLARQGDAAGISYWVKQMDTGAITRAEVVKNFYDSSEFQGGIAPLARLYFAYFNRIPDYPGLQYWINTYTTGTAFGVISNSFSSSEEFIGTYGSLTDDQFVILVYHNVLGRSPDAAGKDYWLSQLSDGMTRGDMMIGFSESDEYKSISYNKVQVVMIYCSMLRRAPDRSGFDYWVTASASGSCVLDLIYGFLNSDEYVNRFN